jgi:hypothetical protein
MNMLAEKKRGRPAIGKGLTIGVRLQPDLVKLVDDYRATFSPVINRAAAIRTIVAERLQRKGKK